MTNYTARRLLDSRQPSSTEVLMRRIGLAVVFAMGLGLMPLAGETQDAGKVHRIGILWPVPSPETKPYRSVFVQALRELGRIEGQHFALEERYLDARREHVDELAASLVAIKVDLIVTPGDWVTRAAKQATATIPIVFLGVTDPVASGYVASFAHPAGNVTGVYPIPAGVKSLEFLREVVPGSSGGCGAVGCATVDRQRIQESCYGWSTTTEHPDPVRRCTTAGGFRRCHHSSNPAACRRIIRADICRHLRASRAARSARGEAPPPCGRSFR